MPDYNYNDVNAHIVIVMVIVIVLGVDEPLESLLFKMCLNHTSFQNCQEVSVQLLGSCHPERRHRV